MAGWVRMPFPPLSLSPDAVAAANEAKMQLISGGGELRAVVMKSRYEQSTFIRRRRIIERQVSSFVVRVRGGCCVCPSLHWGLSRGANERDIEQIGCHQSGQSAARSKGPLFVSGRQQFRGRPPFIDLKIPRSPSGRKLIQGLLCRQAGAALRGDYL